MEEEEEEEEEGEKCMQLQQMNLLYLHLLNSEGGWGVYIFQREGLEVELQVGVGEEVGEGKELEEEEEEMYIGSTHQVPQHLPVENTNLEQRLEYWMSQ
jgi:hypothetical protein